MNPNIIYSAILFKNIILVEYSDYKISSHINLIKTLSEDLKENEGIIEFNNINCFYIKEKEIKFITLVYKSFPEKNVKDFLLSIKDEFNNKINKEKKIENSNSITDFYLKEYTDVLKEKMRFNQENIETEDSVMEEDLINHHQEILNSFIKLLDNDKYIEDFKAEYLKDDSKLFYMHSKKVRWYVKRKRCIIILISVFCFLIIVYIFIGLKCGFDLNKCI